jgi:predicted ATP-grasp superfamily ATP-dependent carboligase
MERAARRGVPVPRTAFIDSIASVRAVADRFAYPAVVKPCRSRIRTPSGWMGAGVHYADSKADLLDLYERTPYLANYPSLIQQRIEGPGFGVFLLCDSGVPIAEFAHRRLRENPPSGGPSVLCESVPVDQGLREHARRLLAPLAWHGVAMVEFKQDQRTGDFFLMEINGRFWGSLQLAVDAGVDFPWLACELARGRRPAPAPSYRVGVKSRWLTGDLDHLLVRAFKTRHDLDLPESAPSRWRAFREFLSFRGSDLHYEVIDASDLRPFLLEARQHLRLLAGSAGRWIRKRLGRTVHLGAQGPAAYSKAPAPGN